MLAHEPSEQQERQQGGKQERQPTAHGPCLDGDQHQGMLEDDV